MKRAERLEAILDELSDGGAVDVGVLSARLGAAPAPIRRDL
ncbi:MAG: DeoR family transcriptional regulator, partial [Actinomycetota bacterium]